MMIEERKVVAGFPAYTISNLGILRKGEKIIKGSTIAGRGWIQVHLRKPGYQRYTKMHTLVLEAFVGPRPPNMECRHLDGVRTNNRLDNLKWGTDQENADDRKLHGSDPRGEQKKNAILTEVIVLDARKRAANGETAVSIAKELGVSSAMLRSVINGTKWKHLPGAIKRKPGPPKLR